MEQQIAILLEAFRRAAMLVQGELLRSTQGTTTARDKRERRNTISRILGDLQRALPDQAWEVIRAAYTQGRQEADSGNAGISLSGPNLRAAQELSQALQGKLEGAIANVGRQADDILRRTTIQELLVSQFAGRPQRATAEAIRDTLQENGVQGFQDSAGRAWTLERYATMAAHTTAQEASTVATMTRLAEIGVDLVEWNARPSVGAQKPCDTCKKLDGTVYSMTGVTSGYPVLEYAPPLHPYCGCVIRAYVETLRARRAA